MTQDEQPLRARGFVAGAAGTLAIGWGVPYATMVIKGSYMDLDFSAPAAIFLFFLLTGGVNGLLRRFAPGATLRPGEMAVAYVMMLVACAVTTMGLSAQLLPIITGPYYYATPENSWASLFHERLRPWLAPQSAFAVNRFYEGLRGGEALPWREWVIPLACWLPFLLTLHLVGIYLMVLLRAQWMERERLAYPLAQLPVEMARNESGASGRSFYHNPALWLGFGMAFGAGCLIGLRAYFPNVPAVRTEWGFPTFRDTTWISLRISFPMIGFFYLVSTETVFSLWFFYLLAWAARGEMNLLGIGLQENLGGYGSPSPVFGHLGTGAMVALVFTHLWMARSHLAASARRAIRGDVSPEGEGEIVSCRTALAGVIVGLTAMSLWLSATGIPFLPMLFFLVLAFVLFIGLTRIVAEAGLAEAMVSAIAPSVSVSALGTAAYGPTGIAGLSTSFVWCSDIRTFVMAAVANGLKVVDIAPRHRRGVFPAVVGSLLLAISASLATILVLAYRHGGINLNAWFFQGAPVAPYHWGADKLLNPAPPNLIGWLLTGWGAAFTIFLAAMRLQYVWWPFHPIGFTVGTTWVMDMIWFSAFLSWILKAPIVRYGGLRRFREFRPFFLGLILGQFTCNGLWLVIDGLTGLQGNMIFWM